MKRLENMKVAIRPMDSITLLPELKNQPREVLKLAPAIFCLDGNRFSINQLAGSRSSRSLIDNTRLTVQRAAMMIMVFWDGMHIVSTSKVVGAEIRPRALLFSSYYLLVALFQDRNSTPTMPLRIKTV